MTATFPPCFEAAIQRVYHTEEYRPVKKRNKVGKVEKVRYLNLQVDTHERWKQARKSASYRTWFTYANNSTVLSSCSPKSTTYASISQSCSMPIDQNCEVAAKSLSSWFPHYNRAFSKRCGWNRVGQRRHGLRDVSLLTETIIEKRTSNRARFWSRCIVKCNGMYSIRC